MNYWLWFSCTKHWEGAGSNSARYRKFKSCNRRSRGFENRRKIGQIFGKHAVSIRVQMRSFRVNKDVVTLTKQMKIDQCERVRVNWQTAALNCFNEHFASNLSEEVHSSVQGGALTCPAHFSRRHIIVILIVANGSKTRTKGE
jgi:hypothetical protein